MRFLKYFLIGSIVLFISFYVFYRVVVLPDLEKWRNRPKVEFESSIGYAPYKFSVHKGWEPDKSYGFPAFRKKISKDLPKNNFHILVQNLKDVTGGKTTTLNEYVDNNVIKELINKHNSKILNVSEYNVDGMAAKSIVYVHPVTIRNLTRTVKAHTIIMLVQDYVYSFDLGSFEKDYLTANKEFELMVNSFHFTEV